MNITIKDETSRFGVRVGAIILNSDKTKVFFQEAKKDFYMFPGGRLEVLEDSYTAIKRELTEELGIDEEVELKYMSENFIDLPNGIKYHEIGFYYLVIIDENKYGYSIDGVYGNLDEEHDGKSNFKWLDISLLDKYNIMPKNIVLKIMKNEIFEDGAKHLIYKEY